MFSYTKRIGKVMLITAKELVKYWSIKPAGVVHVGAHEAEEKSEYEKYDFGPVFWVEAQTELFRKLRETVISPSQVVQALVWDESGLIKTLNVSNNGQSSSVFKFGSHATDHPDVRVTERIELRTVRLDEILPVDCNYNFLNLDIQGAEYEAILGLGDRISQFDYIYCELNRAQVYEGIKQVGELDGYLIEKGFERVATRWTKANWGDGLYIRSSLASSLYGGNFGLRLRVLLFKFLEVMRLSITEILGFLVKVCAEVKRIFGLFKFR